MDGDHGLDIAEEVASVEAVLEQHRHQAGLPVVTVDHVRLETDHRKRGEAGPAEEAELLQIPVPVAVGLRSVEIALIVNKIKGDSLIFVL